MMITKRPDYQVQVSEYLMRITNSHLLLGEQDKDWHTLLVATVKAKSQINKRIRTDEKHAERRSTERYYSSYGAASSGRRGSSASSSAYYF